MNKLGTTSRVLIFSLGLFLAVLLKGFDLVMERHPPFRNYPLLPFCWVSVVIIAWYVGKRPAILSAWIIAIAWFATAPISTSDALVELISRFFNLMYCALFVVFAMPLASYMDLLRKARETTWKDELTQALNAPYFFQRANTELARAGRYQRTFTIAYFSINDFGDFTKRVGSKVATSVLALTADTLIKNLRTADLVGRVGDDEFGVLLPETGHEQAQTVVPRLQQCLLTIMKQRNWSLTFAICAVACMKPSLSLDELIASVRAGLGNAKRERQNGIVYKELGTSQSLPELGSAEVFSAAARPGAGAQ